LRLVWGWCGESFLHIEMRRLEERDLLALGVFGLEGRERASPKERNQSLQYVVDWSWEGKEQKKKKYGFSDNLWSPQTREQEAVPLVFREFLCRSVLLKMQASSLAEVSFSPDEIPRVAEDGRYLASAIAYLKTYEEAAFERLEAAVRRVIPQVERLRVKRTKRQFTETRYVHVEGRGVPIQETREAVGDELVFDMRGVGEITAQDVSEGTLLAVGLLTVLMSPACPNLVLFDDVEQALHPKAQRELIQVLKDILREREDLQIIVTTHSPYIVDALDVSSVCVMAMDAKGAVKTKALSEHPNAARFFGYLNDG
jgi:hypothetical protein